MKLCGFEAGLDQPPFLIAGERRSAKQGPRLRGCAREGDRQGAAGREYRV